MQRALALLVSSMTVFAIGCGDASTPDFGAPYAKAETAASPEGQPPPASASSSDSSSAPSSGAQPVAPLTGTIAFRVANLLPQAADACVSTDGGATWIGPIMHGLSGKTLASGTVSARSPLANAHFKARAVAGATCSTGIGTDVTVDDMPGDWPATIVLAQRGGAPSLNVLLDEPSVSDTETLVRLVQGASWVMDADLGTQVPDCCGGMDYEMLFGDTPFLGIAKLGTLTKQGYAAVDPLSNSPLILQTTTSAEVRLSVNATSDVDQKYTLFTMGDDTATRLIACDDVATPGKDNLTPCVTLNDGDSFGAPNAPNAMSN